MNTTGKTAGTSGAGRENQRNLHEGMQTHTLMQSSRPVLINKSESGWF